MPVTEPAKNNASYSQTALVPSKIDVDEIINNYKSKKGNNIVTSLKKSPTRGSLTERSSHDEKKSFMEKTREGVNLGINKKQLTMMNFSKKGTKVR